MKKLIIFGLTVLTACNFFENKEKKAIEICQKTKVQVFSKDDVFASILLNKFGGAMGLGENSTWLDFANFLAKKDPNKKYDWKAETTEEKNIYLVAFVDQENWGTRWEVDIEQQIVKFINQNEYLSRKYGLSRFDPDGNFEVTNISTSTLQLTSRSSYVESSSKEVVYIFKASVLNKTGKIITDADLSGKLQVIFKDKTVEGENNWNTGFKDRISKSRPWKPNTERDFYIKTNGVEAIYLDYEPEYVFFTINLSAEDPIGFSYDKNIAEYDLKNSWKKLKQGTRATK